METDKDIITDSDFEPIGGIADITTDFEPIVLSQIPDTLEIPKDDINMAIGRGLMLNVSPSLAFESKDILTHQLKLNNLEAIDKDTPKINQFDINTKGLFLGMEKEKLMEEYAGYGARELSSGIDFAFDSPEGKRIAEIENRIQEIATEEQKFNTFQYITGMTGYSARQWGSLMFKLGQGAGWGSIGGLVLGVPTGLGAAVTVPTGATVGGSMAMWQYSYNLEAGNAYHELKKLRDENGNPLEPELIKGAAKAIGTVNTVIELTSDYFILKLIPGGKRLLGTQKGVDMAKREVMDRLKETLSKPSLRKAVLSSIGKLTATSSIEGLEEFIQGISAGRIKEGAKLLSEGEFEPISVVEDAKNSLQEALAAFVGTATTLGLGAGGIEIYNQIGAIKRAEQSQKLFSDMIENVNQSELAKTKPEIYQDAIDRIVSKNEIENIYIPLETWNNYWTNKNIDPKMASLEVSGKEINGNLEIPTGKYMEKIATSPEITSALIGDIKFKEDELSLNEAKKAVEEIKTQTEQSKTEASAEAPIETETKPLTDAEIEAKQDEQLTQLFESDRKLTDDEIKKLMLGEDITPEIVTETPTEVVKPDKEIDVEATQTPSEQGGVVKSEQGNVTSRMEEKFNSITIGEAKEMLKNGDPQFIEELKSAIQEKGKTEAEHITRNLEGIIVGGTSKTERPQVINNIKKIEPEINQVLEGVEKLSENQSFLNNIRNTNKDKPSFIKNGEMYPKEFTIDNNNFSFIGSRGKHRGTNVAEINKWTLIDTTNNKILLEMSGKEPSVNDMLKGYDAALKSIKSKNPQEASVYNNFKIIADNLKRQNIKKDVYIRMINEDLRYGTPEQKRNVKITIKEFKDAGYTPDTFYNTFVDKKLQKSQPPIEQGKVEVDTKLQAKIDKAESEIKRAEAMQELYKIAADCLKGG